MTTLTPNASITAYAAFAGVDGDGRDRTTTVALTAAGGDIVCELGEPGCTLRESLAQRGVAFDVIAVIEPLALAAVGVTPAARDRVSLALPLIDGAVAGAEVFIVTDVMRPVDPAEPSSAGAWALALTRGGGDHQEAAP